MLRKVAWGGSRLLASVGREHRRFVGIKHRIFEYLIQMRLYSMSTILLPLLCYCINCVV